MNSYESLINLTPHDVTLFTSDNKEDKVIFKANPGNIARLYSVPQEKRTELSETWVLPIYSPQEFEGIKGLPEKNGPIIVSEMVARYMHEEAVDWKGLIIFPDTSPDSAVRGEKGEILGVKRFCSYQS